MGNKRWEWVIYGVAALLVIPLLAFVYVKANKSRFEYKLYEAVKTNDLESFKFYEMLGADWKSPVKEFEGYTMIGWIAGNNAVDIYHHLEADDINIETLDVNGLTPLFYAISQKQQDIAIALIESGARVSYEYKVPDRHSRRVHNFGEIHAFHHAAENGLDRVCKVLIDQGNEVDLENTIGMTPLSYAAFSGSLNTVETLIELGANANHISAPLKFALINGHEAIVKLLLENGADPNREKDKFHEVHTWAQSTTSGFYAKFPNLGYTKPWMHHPLTMTIEVGNAEILMHLLQHGANVNYMTERLNSPLHVAAYMDNREIAEILLENGADRHLQNARRLTPAAVADRRGQPELAALMQPLEPLD